MRRDRRERSKQILLAGIIAFIMITSVIGFIARDSEQSYDYGGFSFVRKGNLWSVRINDKEMTFYYFPSETEDVKLDEAIKNKILSTPMVYLTYDPNQTDVEYIAQAQFELDDVLSSNFNVYSAKAMTRENEYGLPVMTCTNATNAVPVLDFRRTNQTAIYPEGDCIILEARSGFDFLRIKDRIMYGMFGVIK